jgi:anti-sigma regulatory factor (Ser/Thr protein kinase)
VSGRCELRLNRAATPAVVRPLRHALRAFLEAMDLDGDLRDDILTAVGEALANAVEHAYDEHEPGTVELFVRTDGEAAAILLADVIDRGHFIERDLRTGRGLGLRIVHAIARTVSIDTEGGTRVQMIFDARPSAPSP